MNAPNAKVALAKNLGGLVYAAKVMDSFVSKWKMKARMIEGSTWVVHKEDGAIKGVVVCVDVPGPTIDAVAFYNGMKWASELGVSLAVIADGELYPKVESTDRYFVGPNGLVIDLDSHDIRTRK